MNPEQFNMNSPESMTEKQEGLSNRREEWVNKLAERGLSPENCSLSLEENKGDNGGVKERTISGTVNGCIVKSVFTISFDTVGKTRLSCKEFTYNGDSVDNPVASERLTRELLPLVTPRTEELQNEANEEILEFNASIEGEKRAAEEKVKLEDRANQTEKEAEGVISKVEKMLFPNV